METTAVQLNFQIDENLSTVNTALSAVSSIVDERITTVRTKVDVQNVQITRLSSKPGKVYSASYIMISSAVS